jgi:hypothetical protein
MSPLTTFALSLALAGTLPIVAVRYLEPILVKVLRGLCDAEGGAEFWVRSAYLLAVSGTLVLLLTFGHFDDTVGAVDALRRTLWLVLAGVFVTVAFIASKVWRQVARLLTTAPPAATRAASASVERSAS